MIFKAKIDKYYIKFIAIMILVLALAILFPLFFEGGDDVIVIIVLLTIFIVTVFFVLWSTFSIKYEFTNDHLFIKGGPYRSKIPYEKMKKIAYTNEILIGYRVMSSKEGVELFYTTALLGSVKISPLEQDAFIDELVKRCPTIEVKI